MDFVFIIIVLVFSLYRTWKNALFPFVFIIFINSLEFWAKTRLPFFYEQKNLLDYYFIGLVAVAFYRHALPYLRKNGIRMTTVELAIILLICYSWLSYNWGFGSIVFENQTTFFIQIIAKQIIFIVLLPLFFRSALGKCNFYNDFALVGLIIVPVIALTMDWNKGRGAMYLFQVVNEMTGKLAEAAYNPLQLGFFGAVLVLFNVFYFRKTALGIASFAVAVPLGFYLMIQAQTRGQLLITLFCLMIFIPFVFRSFKLRYYVVFAPLVFGVGVLAVMNLSEIIAVVFDMLGFDASYARRYSMDIITDRLAMREIRTGIVQDLWLDSGLSMLLGLGTGSSKYYAGSYIHNVTLEVLFEQGLAGMLIYLFALGGVFYSIYTILNIENISIDDRRLAVFISSFFVFSFLITFKQGALYNIYFFWLSAIMPPILSGHLRRKYSKTTSQKPEFIQSTHDKILYPLKTGSWNCATKE